LASTRYLPKLPSLVKIYDMKRNFSENGIYHVYNRGVLKQKLFLDKKDYVRFLFTLMAGQGEIFTTKISRSLGKYRVLDITNFLNKNSSELLKNKYVKVINFCIMPNHYHITLQEVQEGGLSKYMHRLAGSYSKYFNKKYNTNGHVFQGPYKYKPVLTDEKLLYLSAYIHKNPRELRSSTKKYNDYQWSSYADYIAINRWGKFLNRETVLDFHSDKNNYKRFVKESQAKEAPD
jgi:putative transposase